MYLQCPDDLCFYSVQMIYVSTVSRCKCFSNVCPYNVALHSDWVVMLSVKCQFRCLIDKRICEGFSKSTRIKKRKKHSQEEKLLHCYMTD